MEGQAQFDMNMESENGMQFISATYVPEVDRKSSDEAPIQFNFSPCLAFSGEIAVLSSSIPLAKQLAAEVAKAPKMAKDPILTIHCQARKPIRSSISMCRP